MSKSTNSHLSDALMSLVDAGSAWLKGAIDEHFEENTDDDKSPNKALPNSKKDSTKQ